MEDTLISLETAKLAKEKGFLGFKSRKYFRYEDNCLIHGILEDWRDWNLIVDHASAPTQSLLQKWLREKYFLDLRVERNDDGWCYSIMEFSQGNRFIDRGIRETPNYEDELEKGLQESLKLIHISKKF